MSALIVPRRSGLHLERPGAPRLLLARRPLTVAGPGALRRLAGRIRPGEDGVLGTHPYVFGYLNAFAKKINYTADSIMLSLHTSSFVPAQTQEWESDLTNEVAAGNGYTTGGNALTSLSSTVTGSTHTLSAANASWTSSGAGFGSAFAVGRDTTPGSAGTNPLLFWVDFGGTQTISGGAVLNINWNASGIFAVTVT